MSLTTGNPFHHKFGTKREFSLALTDTPTSQSNKCRRLIQRCYSRWMAVNAKELYLQTVRFA